MSRLFKTKSLANILKEAEDKDHSLKRALGPVQITLLGIGAIIGAGIFATIGTAAAGDSYRPGAGPALMLSFVLAGIVCAFTALCYAEFASMVPISGSAYTYSYATLGELIAWIIGWDLIIEYAVGNVAVAISWANYFKTFLREAGIIIPDWISTDFHTAHKIPGLIENAPHIFGIPIVFNLLAFIIIAAITVILLIGIRESAWFNAIMVIIKLIVLFFFIFIGIKYLNVSNWQPFIPNGWKGIASGAAIIFFAYIGFDAVSTVAEEAKKPQRDLPIGIIGSLAICTILYIIIAGVFTGIIPYKVLVNTLANKQAEPLTLALEYAHLKGFAIYFVAFGSVVAHTAVLFVFQLGQPRIFFSMARDGLLPHFFAKIHPRFKTPWGSTIITGIAVGSAAMISSLDEMVDLTNIGTLFAFILVCTGIIILRYKEPDRIRPFRVPFGILFPSLGIIGCLGLIYYLPPTSWLRFAAWLNIGFVIYISYSCLKSKLNGKIPNHLLPQHLIETAYAGSFLAIIGTALVIIARIADIIRLDNQAPPSWWFDNSWWLTIPLLINAFILSPIIINRTLKNINKIPPSSKKKAKITLILSFTSSILILIYMFCIIYKT